MKKIKCLSMTALVLGLICMFTINSQAQELKVLNQKQSAIKVEQKKAKANAMTHKVVERKDKVDLKAKPATQNATLNANQKLVRTSAATRTAPNNAKKAQQSATRNVSSQDLKAKPANRTATLSTNQRLVKTPANRTTVNSTNRTVKKTTTTVQKPVLTTKSAAMKTAKPQRLNKSSLQTIQNQ